MPLLLLFAVSDQSLVMIANSELVAVEIVRTLCGSIGFIAAVPITTALAAAVLRPTGGEPLRAEDDPPPRRPRRPPVVPKPSPAAVSHDAPNPTPLPRVPRWDDFAPDDTH